MYEEITKMTDLELEELEKLVAVERDKRAKKEATEALNEMVALIQKWGEKHISFYIHDSYDNPIIIYSREVCVDRGRV